MQTNKKLRMVMAALLPTTAGLWCVQSVHAAGFALMEQNSSGLGNAYAGSAAVAEDASTIFFNSAGLTQLKRPSVVVNAAAIYVKSEFNNTGSQAALGQTSLGGNGGNTGGLVVLPAIYFGMPVSDKVSGGVGINAPFGLKTDYDDGWIGRFQALKSEVKTTNINTALAFKLHDKVSLGIGADFQTIDATLTSAVNYDGVLALNGAGALIPTNLNLAGTAKIKGTDSAWGYDIGLLFTPFDGTRIGLSYRSSIKYALTGTATFVAPTSSNPTVQGIINAASNSTNPAAPTNGPVKLDLELPASARVALVQKLGGSVELLGEVSWTEWSSIQNLTIRRANGGLLKDTPENWENAMRYALGANWQVNNNVKLRVGFAYDESLISADTDRTARLPDGDRKWLALGAKFNVLSNTSLDVGYMHVFVKDANLNQADGQPFVPAFNAYPNGLLLGQQQTKIDILGVQATVSF